MFECDIKFSRSLVPCLLGPGALLYLLRVHGIATYDGLETCISKIEDLLCLRIIVLLPSLMPRYMGNQTLCNLCGIGWGFTLKASTLWGGRERILIFTRRETARTYTGLLDSKDKMISARVVHTSNTLCG